MSIRELPARPSLEHLKKQARTLLEQIRFSDPSALARFAAFVPASSQPKLADALHVVAREHGFDTWPALKLHIEVQGADPIEALTSAIKANSALLVRDVLSRHPSLRAQIDMPLPNDAFGTPALLAAVQQNNREMVDLLLDAGADVNRRSEWWAGSFGVLDMASTELADYLMVRGAAVDIHAACRLGRLDRVRELLSANAQLVHARGGDGQLPLHFAATVEIAALLLDHGAEIDARDIDHESTAAQYMVCTRQMMQWREPHRHDVARFLIDKGAKTDILMASALGDVSLVERILNHDPETIRTTVSERYFPKTNPESGGSIYLYGFGRTRSPHMVAHQFGHNSTVELLMQRSPVWLRLVNRAEFGEERQFHGLITDHPNFVQQLSPNASRLIIGPVFRNNAKAVALLLDAGWPSNAALENKQTTLHFAAWHGNLTMVRALLEHGAAVNVFESEHGGSPLAWALHGSLNSWEREKGNYPDVVRLLLDAGAVIPKPERPLEASDEVLAVITQHAQQAVTL